MNNENTELLIPKLFLDGEKEFIDNRIKDMKISRPIAGFMLFMQVNHSVGIKQCIYDLISLNRVFEKQILVWQARDSIADLVVEDMNLRNDSNINEPSINVLSDILENSENDYVLNKKLQLGYQFLIQIVNYINLYNNQMIEVEDLLLGRLKSEHPDLATFIDNKNYKEGYKYFLSKECPSIEDHGECAYISLSESERDGYLEQANSMEFDYRLEYSIKKCVSLRNSGYTEALLFSIGMYKLSIFYNRMVSYFTKTIKTWSKDDKEKLHNVIKENDINAALELAEIMNVDKDVFIEKCTIAFLTETIIYTLYERAIKSQDAETEMNPIIH